MQLPPPQPVAISPWQRVRTLLLRWLISSLAMFAAIYLVPGINFTGPGWQVGVVALVFGLINAVLRPILALLTCPLVLLTLGLFMLVINALLLMLTAEFAGSLGIAFTIDGFWPAFFGGLVISFVSTLLGFLTGDSTVVVVRHGPTDRPS
jgi:putative membrane protein